jgi:hypothetical protein
MRGHRHLRLVVTVTLVCAVGSLITPLGAIRLVFAVPLALILPGYAVTAAAFGSRRPDRLERLPLTLGVSLACLALGGLILNYTPGGIRGLPWALLLVLVVLAGCLVAARRRGSTRDERTSFTWPKPSPASAILAAGSLAMVVAALILAHTTVKAEHVYGYTQLWISPPTATGKSARIGVTSEQQQARNYRLVVEVEGRPGSVSQSFQLEPSQTHLLRVPSGQAASPVRVEARLYLRGHPSTVYRRVFAWLGGRGSSAARGPGAPGG